MRTSIKRVIVKLEKQSLLEKTRKVVVSPEKRMLTITPNTARFLHSVLTSINAKNILELGMSTGYSTLWFVDALLNNSDKPKIITVEKNPIKIQMAKSNFKTAGISKFIKIKHGEILNVLAGIPKKQTFDFVLIDADKENILEYFDLVLPMVKIGGIIVTDNVILPQKYQKFMCKYTKHIKTNRNVVTGTIPIGYGEEITVRIS